LVKIWSDPLKKILITYSTITAADLSPPATILKQTDFLWFKTMSVILAANGQQNTGGSAESTGSRHVSAFTNLAAKSLAALSKLVKLITS